MFVERFLETERHCRFESHSSFLQRDILHPGWSWEKGGNRRMIHGRKRNRVHRPTSWVVWNCLVSVQAWVYLYLRLWDLGYVTSCVCYYLSLSWWVTWKVIRKVLLSFPQSSWCWIFRGRYWLRRRSCTTKISSSVPVLKNGIRNDGKGKSRSNLYQSSIRSLSVIRFLMFVREILKGILWTIMIIIEEALYSEKDNLEKWREYIPYVISSLQIIDSINSQSKNYKKEWPSEILLFIHVFIPKYCNYEKSDFQLFIMIHSSKSKESISQQISFPFVIPLTNISILPIRIQIEIPLWHRIYEIDFSIFFWDFGMELLHPFPFISPFGIILVL